MIKAAGILFVAGKNALFLKRSSVGDHAGEWCFPGGKLEDTDKDLLACAMRECVEEIGSCPEGVMAEHTRTITNPAVNPSTAASGVLGDPMAAPSSSPDTPALIADPSTAVSVDFTTFLCKVDGEFTPVLDGEHVGYAWAPVDNPPEPLHPGCRIAIARLTMDEVGIAAAISTGQLVSPQRYENMSLFDLRITGTGTAYRKRLDEYVYRAPENYLTPEFLQRCNGLPVIMQHPEKLTLDSKEFSDRVVGTILLPYIKGDEVWGIAKIYDDAAVKMMEELPLSTSPAVIFRDLSVNDKLELENGSKVLIEGKPSLLDHLAICEHGVWDKGEGPTGVNSVATGDDSMTKEDEKVDEKKEVAQVDSNELLGRIADSLDDLKGRMDSLEDMEKKKSDAEDKEEKMKKDDSDEEDEDKKKSDEDDKEDDKKKSDEPGDKEEMAKNIKDREEKDKKKSDEDKEEKMKKADSDDIRTQLADINKRLNKKPTLISDEDHRKMASAQADADSVFQAHGKHAPRPLDGEGLVGYRKRLAGMLKEHSPTWDKIDIGAFADDALDVAEKQIYADAMQAALKPVGLPDGVLREIHSTDTTGRRHTTFAGEPRAWMSSFASHRRRLAGIRNAS